MKRFFLFLAIIGITNSANSQVITIVNHYQSFWGNIWDPLGGVSLDVTNIGSTDLTLVAIRSANLLATGHESYFCYGVKCYDSSVDTADQFITIPAGQTVASTLVHYLKPLGNAGSSEVHYCLVDTTNAADSVCFRFTYIASVTGINENITDGNVVKLSPNPADGFVSVDLVNANDGIIHVYDSNGKLIYDDVLNNKTDIIDVSNWPQGLYIVGSPGTGAYGKLSVRH